MLEGWQRVLDNHSQSTIRNSTISLQLSRVNGENASLIARIIPVLEQGNFRSYTRFNQLLTNFLAEAEHIFVLTTTDCQFENLPSLWEGKSSCVNVAKFDAAYYGAGTPNPDHNLRVTNSHRTLIQLAQLLSLKSVAIIEGDASSYKAIDVDMSALRSFKKLVDSDSWDIIRFGYRPYFLEDDIIKDSNECPTECKCSFNLEGHSMGGLGCVITSSRCDMRSSDAYMLKESSFEQFELALGRYSVDMEPMRLLPKIWFSVPQLAFQMDSAQLVEAQVRIAKDFRRLCVE